MVRRRPPHIPLTVFCMLVIPRGGLSGVYQGLLTVVGFGAVMEEVNQNKEDSFIYVSSPSAFPPLLMIRVNEFRHLGF